MLRVDDIHVYYGNIHAIKGVSLEIQPREIVTLIGANGAGKSTTLRAISGLTPHRQGRVSFEGQPLEEVPTSQRVARGLVHCPEGRQIFANLTVEENLRIGAFLRRDKAGIMRDLERVYVFFPRLKERLKQLGGTLSGGEQQMLAIGRALLSQPKLLLLDEPSLGLAPLIVKQIFEIILKIREEGVTILLVEQNANAALKIADRAYVIETGKVTLSGDPQKLLHDPEVQAADLGL